MQRKTKDKSNGAAKEIQLARASDSPFAWFEEMDRWFNDFRRGFEERFWGAPLMRPAEAALRVREPLVDLVDEGAEFVVRAELPGVSREDVDLKVTADGIEIRAETKRSREEKEKNYFFQERTHQVLQRFLRFPEEVKADLASATLKDGILEARIPKNEPTLVAKPVQVPVE